MAVCTVRCSLLVSCIVAAFQVSVGGVMEEPKCAKVDTCSCKLKNVNNTGLISLNNLVDGSPNPRFISSAGKYFYYYNPCTNFVLKSTNKGCEDGVALCQMRNDSIYAFNLGKAEDLQFTYINGSVFAVYANALTPEDGYKRTSEIELVCDESTYGRFEFVGEPVATMYKFKLSILCVCLSR